MTKNRADARASFAQAWDGTDPAAGQWPEVALLTDHPAAASGWTALGVRGGRGITVLPELLPGAPPEVERRYYARAMATLAGRCPLCDQAAGLSADPQRTPAAWAVAPLTVDLSHAEGCRAVFTEADRQWFHPDAIGRSQSPEEAP